MVSILGLLATVTLVLGSLSTGLILSIPVQTVHAQSSPGCPISISVLCENGFFDFEPPAPGGSGGGLGSDIIIKAQDRLSSVADNLNQRFDQINQRLESLPIPIGTPQPH
jgi:hypothetical protein